MRRASYLLVPACLLAAVCAVAAEPDYPGALRAIANEIEALKGEYPQLRDFSASASVDTARLAIDYSFHTHEPAPTGGWTSGVPNPDDDGIWFHIDLHDPGSSAEIHTQPRVSTRARAGGKQVYMLILEGEKTRRAESRLWAIVKRHAGQLGGTRTQSPPPSIPPPFDVRPPRSGPRSSLNGAGSGGPDQAGLWKDELWFIERTAKVNWREPGSSTSLSALRHVSLKELESAGPAIPLEPSKAGSSGQLLPVGDRLWVIGADRISYYQNGVLTRLSGAGRAARSSRPFAYQGRPAVISLGAHPSLATLQDEGARAVWTAKDLPLGLPAESGSLRTLQAVESKGGLYLFAELCTDDPDRCSISYRQPDQGAWLPLVEDSCSCATWTALASESLPTVVLSERAEGRETVSVITLTAGGPRRKPVALPKERSAWGGWRALCLDGRLVLLTQGMPGSLSLLDVADGRVVRSVRKTGSFPFGPNMMLFMLIPELLPILLSLLLALLLTGQMRRHRVQGYVFAGTRRTFASLWQRALAQLVDLVPLSAAFLIPSAWIWRMFSDPESLVESGPMFPFVFIGLFVGAFLCALLVLLAFSYFEGRSGRTPGKWLLGIRVLGTDLQPCGFGRAVLRNMLSFVDGFFSFLVGALLVALTENWQRLGDMAARTIVVVDEKPA